MDVTAVTSPILSLFSPDAEGNLSDPVRENKRFLSTVRDNVAHAFIGDVG